MCPWVGTLALIALSLAGCGPSDKVTYVPADDPQMNAAMEKARASVPTFTAALKAPRPGQSAFSVKVAFVDGDNVEYMWLTPVTFDGSKFTGIVNNVPLKVKTVKLDEKVTVASDKISDWMYIENHRLVGGETLGAPRAGMSPAERQDFDKGVPFTVD